jgi:tRNA(fMet)-specific endonuclease VapC
MTPELMLDTNAVSAVVKGRAHMLEAMLDERAFCISVITEAELRFGLARRPVNADLRRIVEGFLRTVAIRPWTSACAEHYARLRAQLEAGGKPLAPMDLLIASHALAEECMLVSADRAFAHVPGLRMFDWSVDGTPRVGEEPAQLAPEKPGRGRTRTKAATMPR